MSQPIIEEERPEPMHDIEGTIDISQGQTYINFKLNGVERTAQVDENGYFYYDLTTQLTNLQDAFSDTTTTSGHITSLAFGPGFDTSNVTNFKRMFSGCDVSSLNVSNFDTSSATDMNSMFGTCSNLTSLNLSNFNTSSVTDMSYMFSGCTDLTSLDLSSFTTANVTNMSYMFSNCTFLTYLNISSFNTANVTNMNYMFKSTNLGSALDVSNFNTANVTAMSYMFDNAKLPSTFNLSHFNVYKVTNISHMFNNISPTTITLNLRTWNTANVGGSSYYANFVPNRSSVTVRYTSTFSSTIRNAFPNVNWTTS